MRSLGYVSSVPTRDFRPHPRLPTKTPTANATKQSSDQLMNFLLRELLNGFNLDPARPSHTFGVISSVLNLPNPHTGKRRAWRDLSRPTISGVTAERPMITDNGASYLYGYSLSLYDLYTVNGVH